MLCSPSHGRKDAEGNARKNADVLQDKFDDEVLSHIVGGTTDNASSALQENQFVFDKIQHRLSISPIPAIAALTHVNGVYKRCIKLGDLFHINKLVVSHYSVAVMGDTENAQYSQIHHRQNASGNGVVVVIVVVGDDDTAKIDIGSSNNS